MAFTMGVEVVLWHVQFHVVAVHDAIVVQVLFSGDCRTNGHRILVLFVS